MIIEDENTLGRVQQTKVESIRICPKSTKVENSKSSKNSNNQENESEVKEMSEIRRRDGIKVAGRIGTWYVVSEKEYDGKMLYLVESEIYGDEAGWLVIDEDFNEVADEIYNGWEDYDYIRESEEYWND